MCTDLVLLRRTEWLCCSTVEWGLAIEATQAGQQAHSGQCGTASNTYTT